MTEPKRLAAFEAIRQVKATYIRGVDTGDAALIRSILHDDCELDYRGCFVDPRSGIDFFPAMGIVLKGRRNFGSALVDLGIVSVHQVYTPEIALPGEASASAIWPMSDRLWLPAGSEYAHIAGYGHYHETYEQAHGAWKLKTTRITRLRVEGVRG